jgi:hypothetical protein
MNLADIDIEWIIREVVRRLREAEHHQASEAHDSTPATKQPRQHSLELNEPVITLATIDKRLNDVEHVVVARRAIVTPAVVDALKDRGIQLSRSGSTTQQSNGKPAQTAAGGPLVLSMSQSVNNKELAKLLPGVRVVCAASGSLENALEELSKQKCNRAPAVLLTTTPAAAVVTANRNPKFRAAVGFDFPAIRRAVGEAGANLLALDPSGKSPTQISALVNEFFHRD